MTSAPDASRLAGATRFDNANMLAYERYLRRAISEARVCISVAAYAYLLQLRVCMCCSYACTCVLQAFLCVCPGIVLLYMWRASERCELCLCFTHTHTQLCLRFLRHPVRGAALYVVQALLCVCPAVYCSCCVSRRPLPLAVA
jgi:hypothetical protein